MLGAAILREAAILRLFATGAAVVVMVIAASVAKAAIRADNAQWWKTVLGIGFALALVFAAYAIARNGNFGAFYGTY